MPYREMTKWLIDGARDRMVDWIQRVPVEQWEQPGPDGGWSMKDLAGHVTLWNDICCDMLEPVRDGLAPKPWPMSDEAGLHKINADDIARRRSDSVETVWSDFEVSMARAQDLIEALPADAFEPGADPPDIIRSNTYGHWPEHMAQLRKLVRHLQP